MEESEHDTKRGNFEQENDSDQPRQNDKLVPKSGATSVAWTWFGYEKSANYAATWSFYINYSLSLQNMCYIVIWIVILILTYQDIRFW